MPIAVRWAYDSADLTPSGSELVLRQILAGQLTPVAIIYFEAATPQFIPPVGDGKAESGCPDCVQNAPQLQRFISEMQGDARETTLVRVIASFSESDWKHIDKTPNMDNPFRRRPWNEYGSSAGLPFAVAAEKHGGELFVTYLERNPTYNNLLALLGNAVQRARG